MMDGHTRKIDSKKLSSGLIFMSTGVVAFIWAQQYTIGTATEMGPGYFPAMLGLLLAILGGAAVFQGIRTAPTEEPEVHSLVPLALILLSVVSFGFVIGHAGLVPAIFVAILFACLRRIKSHPIEVFVTFVVLATFCSVVFVHFFGMPVPLFLWPF